LPDSEWLVLSDVKIEALEDFTGDGFTDIISIDASELMPLMRITKMSAQNPLPVVAGRR
jgi:hypothetical protein